MPKIKQLEDIVDWRLCLGCGACQYICPEDKISLVNRLEEGIRPQRANQDCSGCTACVEVCPAVQSDFSQLFEGRRPSDFENDWGAIAGIWEGYATDEEIRFKGSSGGALTALSAYCLEVEKMGGVLHIGQDPANPVLNSTRLSKTRDDLMKTTGSRYSPASVCDRLDLVENASAPSAVIGKPAEISAVRNAMKMRPALADKVGVTMSFFCAETPPTQATLSLLDVFKEDATKLSGLRYRGYGWPGFFTVSEPNGESREHWIYQKSWAYLQKFRPWSVHMWPDGAGELADISCGDPWYEEPDGKNPGFSLIVARTPLGKRIIECAMNAGYLHATIAEPWKLAKSQSGLLDKKGSVWGRRVVSKSLGLPITEFKGTNLFRIWKKISTKRRVQSFTGTLKRLFSRGYLKRQSPPSRALPQSTISD